MVKTITLKFDDKEFKQLQNNKEEAKINDWCDSWEDYILWSCGVRE